VRLDGLPQIRRAPVVQEEDALAEAPERRGPELVASGLALEDVVGQAISRRSARTASRSTRSGSGPTGSCA